MNPTASKKFPDVFRDNKPAQADCADLHTAHLSHLTKPSSLKIKGKIIAIKPSGGTSRIATLLSQTVGNARADHRNSNSIISIGEILSGACALHCIAYMAVSMVLSVGFLGSYSLTHQLEWLEGIWWHIGFGAAAAVFAMLSRRSISTHGSVPRIYDILVMSALTLMICSICIEGIAETQATASGHHHHGEHSHNSWQFLAHALFIGGNAMIIGAHYWARRILKSCRGQCLH
jgi:hypothetical protein